MEKIYGEKTIKGEERKKKHKKIVREQYFHPEMRHQILCPPPKKVSLYPNSSQPHDHSSRFLYIEVFNTSYG